MQLYVFSVGKSKKDNYYPLINEYFQRIKKRIKFKEKEFKTEETLLKSIPNSWNVILFDEKGKEPLSSNDFAHFVEKQMSTQTNNIVFIIGGAYGSSDKLKQRANSILSLSNLTFPHRLAKLILAEQIYRALTILKGEPYSH